MKFKISAVSLLPRRSQFSFPVVAGFLGLLFLLLLPLHAQDSPKPDSPKTDSQEKASPAQDSEEKVDVNDVPRTYVVHLPQGYNQQQHYPVVILLHGRNQDAGDMAGITHFNRLADKDSIIAIYPNAAHGSWNIGVRAEPVNQAMQPRRGGRRGGWEAIPVVVADTRAGVVDIPAAVEGGYPGGRQTGEQNPEENKNRAEPPDDVAFLNQMLDQLPMKYSVDTRRIYATGLGDGGFMALRVGCNMADRVAAIAAVGAAMPKTMICLPARAASVLFIKGTDDPIVPDNGGTYKPGRFHVLSAEDSAKTWAKFDHCGEKPEQAKLPPAEKGGKETKTYSYSGCQDNAQVVLYSVKNGGNTWPGGEQYMSEKEVGKTSNALNANDAIWNFLVTKKIAGESGVEK